jgi:hypothetical protein
MVTFTGKSCGVVTRQDEGSLHLVLSHLHVNRGIHATRAEFLFLDGKCWELQLLDVSGVSTPVHEEVEVF